MAVTQDRWCPKCKKKVRMTRCEVCKGTGGPGGCPFTGCREVVSGEGGEWR